MPFETKSRYLQQFEPKLSRLGGDQDLWWVVPFSVRYIVGISGHRFAGTSTALTYLGEKLGFKVYTLSHELREIARAQGVPLNSRSHLQDLGDELRAERRDAGYLARLTLQRIRADQLDSPESRARIAVGGFKHPEEVKVFEKLDAFHFLWLDVGFRTRYKRACESGVWAPEQDGQERQIGPTRFQREIDGRDRNGCYLYQWTDKYGQWVDGILEQSKPSKVLRNGRFDRGELFTRLSKWAEQLDEQHQNPELPA